MENITNENKGRNIISEGISQVKEYHVKGRMAVAAMAEAAACCCSS